MAGEANTKQRMQILLDPENQKQLEDLQRQLPTDKGIPSKSEVIRQAIQSLHEKTLKTK